MDYREKITLAKTELYKVTAKVRKLKHNTMTIYNQRLSLMGSGLDYSKDKIQSSPTNAIERVMANIDLLERENTELKNAIGFNLHQLLLLDNREAEVINNLYFRDLSIYQTSKRMKVSKRTVNTLRNKALINYCEKVLKKV